MTDRLLCIGGTHDGETWPNTEQDSIGLYCKPSLQNVSISLCEVEKEIYRKRTIDCAELTDSGVEKRSLSVWVLDGMTTYEALTRLIQGYQPEETYHASP